jgi:putative oxidoreductase
MTVERFAIAAGRALLASLFIAAGLMFFRRPDFAFAESVIAGHGLPYARILLICTIFIQIGCGGMMLVNWHARWAALTLLVWLIPATMLFHAFWAAPPEQVADQTIHFLKNVAVAGALLLVVGASPAQPLVAFPTRRATAQTSSMPPTGADERPKVT